MDRHRQPIWFVLLLLSLLCAASGHAQFVAVNITNFDSSLPLVLQRNAAFTNGRVRLANQTQGTSGGVWLDRRQFLLAGFESEFQFQFTWTDGVGADGLAFVIQNNETPRLGTGAAQIGYGEIPNSLAVEFDTFQNGGADLPPVGLPNYHEIAIASQGAAPNSVIFSNALAWNTNFPAFGNGTMHSALIRYTPGSLAVYLDNALIVTAAVDLATLFPTENGQAWVGFTGGGGGFLEDHDILNWKLTLTNTPLTAMLTALAEGASFIAPASIALSAEATDTNAPPDVRFYADTVLIGSATGPEANFIWSNAPPGRYTLTAVASNALGQIRASPGVRITVAPPLPAIGVNFARGAGANYFPLAPTATAGFVAQANWNNADANSSGDGALANLVDADGNPTLVAVSYNFQGTGDQAASLPYLSGDDQLARGNMQDRAVAGGSTLIVTNVPYARYDLLIYNDGNNSTEERVASFTLDGQTVFIRDASRMSSAGLFAEAAGTVDDGVTTPPGNFVRFRNLTADTFTVQVAAGSSTGTPRAHVTGFQIVPSLKTNRLPTELFPASNAAVIETQPLELLLGGDRNRTYLVEASTNLVDWSALQSVFSTNELMPVVDSASTNFQRRFYRAIQQ